jgi:hypothetical protein
MRTRKFTAFVATLAGMLGIAACAQAATTPNAFQSTAPVSAAYTTAANTTYSLANALVQSDESYSGANGSRSYANGVWTNTTDETCWVCNIGPASIDAVMATNDPTQLPVVIDTMNTAIQNQQPNGSFIGTGEDPGINTIFFLQQLGDAYIMLQSQLSAATQAKWANAIESGANYLISNGNTTFYANGNINLAETEIMYLAWRVSGAQSFLNAYNQSWQFVETPGTARWAGYGLVTTQQPSASASFDSDGSGYLTENGGSGPGFDPSYTMLQLDVATELFVLSHDARALDLMNLLANQELPLINKASFVLNASSGSRHSLMEGFISTGMIVLSRYGRSDLQPLIAANMAQIDASYGQGLVYANQTGYIGLARDLEPLLMDDAGVQVIPAPGAPTAYLSPAGSSAPTTSVTGTAAAPVAGTATPTSTTTTTSSTVRHRHAKAHRHSRAHKQHHSRRHVKSRPLASRRRPSRRRP